MEVIYFFTHQTYNGHRGSKKGHFRRSCGKLTARVIGRDVGRQTLTNSKELWLLHQI